MVCREDTTTAERRRGLRIMEQSRERHRPSRGRLDGAGGRLDGGGRGGWLDRGGGWLDRGGRGLDRRSGGFDRGGGGFDRGGGGLDRGGGFDRRGRDNSWFHSGRRGSEPSGRHGLRGDGALVCNLSQCGDGNGCASSAQGQQNCCASKDLNRVAQPQRAFVGSHAPMSTADLSGPVSTSAVSTLSGQA